MPCGEFVFSSATGKSLALALPQPSAAASCSEAAPWTLNRKGSMPVCRTDLEVYVLVYLGGPAVLVLERINTPEPPRYLVFVFLAFFLVLGFLIVSAKVFAIG